MKIKDLKVSDVMFLKYLTCRFIMNEFDEDDFLDDIISERTKERLAEKHSIQDADKKDLDLVIYQITQGHTKEEKESLVSATYDYVVNSMFAIENIDELSNEEYFPDSLIIKPKHHIVAAKLKSRSGTSVMRVMPIAHFRNVINNSDGFTIKHSMTATENSSGNEYAIVII